MFNFCTLFDVNYLSRGITMYRSLENACPSFHLYVFAFDDKAFRFLSVNKNSFPHLTVISLAEFEDEALLQVKPTRSIAEYCWTCTPSTILYCISRYQLDHCTYIDADMYFYHDPTPLIEEMGNASVLISEHRYTPAYDQSAYSGIYCVQFMCFKKTTEGLNVLQWWRDRCIEWCYGRLEDGKFGDQKYLDNWTTRFPAIHVMEHPGGGVAPWNVQQYNIDAGYNITEKKTSQTFPLIFFHFHGLKFFADNKVSLCGSLYELDTDSKQILYFPYIKNLLQTAFELKALGFDGNSEGGNTQAPARITQYFRFLKETLVQIKNGKLSPFSLKNFNFSRHNHIYTTDQFR